MQVIVQTIEKDISEKGGSKWLAENSLSYWQIVKITGGKYKLIMNKTYLYDPGLYDTLNIVYDPVKYINYLFYAPSIGLPVMKIAQSVAYISVPGLSAPVSRHFLYTNFKPELFNTFLTYVAAFYEVISARYLKEAFNILDIAQIEDLGYLEKSYSVLLNRIVPEIKRILSQHVQITVKYSDTHSKKFTNTLAPFAIPADTVIPEILKPYTKDAVFADISRAMPVFTLQEMEAYKKQAENDAGIAKVYSDAHYMPIKIFDIKSAILGMTAQAMRVIAMNITKAEGRISQLSDPASKLTRTETQTDPFKNPFLVYNAQKSNEAGEPIYENLAVNESFSMKDLEKYYTSPLISTKYMNQAEDIRNEFSRQYQMEKGGSISRREIAEIDKDKKGSILPVLGAGAAAAFIAWQATQ
jgi:hypothetical protein